MKARIIVTDDKGNTFEGTVLLEALGKVAKERGARKRTAASHSSALSFQLNTRAFMKTHGKGKSGPQKFTLLLAKLAGGKASVQVSLEEMKTLWNNMTTVMGGPFNAAHSNRAKENGWVDSPKRGSYVLSSSWKEMLMGG